MFLAAVFLCAEWTIVASYPIPEGASGLAYDGTYLYCGIYGANGDEFYRIDPDDGTYQLLFTNPNIGDCFGMTWDGTNLWITDHVSPSSTPAIAYELDINSGVILSQFDLPAHYMSGIAYDNGDFWVTAYYDPNGEIYKVDNTGAIIQQFAAPDEQPWDLCLENDNLWMADYWGDALYKIDPVTGTLLETNPSEGVDPAGIVWDGQYLWYCDNGSGGSDYLYKVDLAGSGTPQMNIYPTVVDYGIVTVGDMVYGGFTITNDGSADLEVTFGSITGPGSQYVFWGSGATTIPANGGTMIFEFAYSPQEPGILDAIGTLYSNDPLYPVAEISFIGIAVNPGPEIYLPVTNHDYGSVRINAYTRWFMEIQNIGDEALIINDIYCDDIHFTVDSSVSFPIEIATLDTIQVGIWFSPDAATNFNGVMSIHSNDPVTPIYDVTLSGTGDASAIPIGGILWQYNITTGYDNSPKAIVPIEDISEDGIDDVIICSQDNFTRCFNGNSSGIADILWEYETYAGEVYHQNSLMIVPDLNSDGYEDVVIGTTGGDRAIRAISGKTGEQIWVYFTDVYGDGGWVYQVDATFDYNNDGITDILAATGGDAQRVFCIDGTNGTVIWDFYAAGPKFSCIGIEDVNNDGIPDAIGGASNSYETEGKVFGINGANGTQMWEFTTDGSSVWALSQVDDISGDGYNDIVVGDFAGNYYALDATNGSVLWNESVGTCLIIRFETLNDVNGDGHPDIAIARSSIDNAVVIDGYTGLNIWLHPVADQPWVVDKIGDITGDGINDIVWGTLFQSNYGYFLDGATGAELASISVGTAVDAIAGIPDIANDGSWEMVIGGRNGTVLCVSGGEAIIVDPGWIEGMVTLNGGPGPVENVEITADGITVYPDATGFYSLELDPGAYDVTASLVGYQLFEVLGIAVITGQITNLDITLNFMFPPQNLTYVISGGYVILNWDAPNTVRELLGYKVYRDGTEIAEILNPTITTYSDPIPGAGTFEYGVTALYDEGESEPVTVNVVITNTGNILVPLETKLNGNYPNPFNPSTTISFQLAEKNLIELVIYNMKGQKVKELMNSNLDAGYYKVVWNGKDDQNRSVSSGIYFYKMISGKYVSTGKCILLK